MKLIHCIPFLLAARHLSANLVVPPECASLNSKARALDQAGAPREAETLLVGWINRLNASAGDRACLGLSLYNLAVALESQGKLAEAARIAARSLPELEAVMAPDDPMLRRPLQFLAQSAVGKGDSAAAWRFLSRLERIPPAGAGDSAMVHGLTATLLSSTGKPGEAETEYLRAIADWERAGRLDSFGLGAELVNLANLYGGAGRNGEAIALLERALPIVENPPFNPVTRAKAIATIAVLQYRANNRAVSEQYFQRALSLTGALPPGPEQELARWIYTQYAGVLRKWNRKKEAKLLEEEAKARFGPDPSKNLVTAESLRQRSAQH
jgi:tetratricopeptide (TPR) repeat protein